MTAGHHTQRGQRLANPPAHTTTASTSTTFPAMSSPILRLARGSHRRVIARRWWSSEPAGKSAASSPPGSEAAEIGGSAQTASTTEAAAAGGAEAEKDEATRFHSAAKEDASASSSSSSASGSSELGTAGAAADDAARAAKAAAAGFSKWAKSMGDALNKGAGANAGGMFQGASRKGPPSAGGLLGAVMDAFKEEYRLAMMDPGDAAAERRKQQPGYSAPGPVEEYTGTTSLAVAKEKKSALRRGWEALANKAGLTSVFSKLEGLKQTPAYKKGEEALEDMRERWETSDNPMVHKIQDMQESMFAETEQAEAYRVIRQRQPDFNINDFLAEVRRDVPKVLGAYLKGDIEALAKTNTSKEMLERMGGQMKLWQHEGQYVDPRVLHLSDLELVEVRMMEGEPLVVLQFSCQQINCVRNKTGEIVEGAEDDIQAVHYLWAMQLSNKDLITEDGREYAAYVWQLREMVLRGMMAIV